MGAKVDILQLINQAYRQERVCNSFYKYRYLGKIEGVLELVRDFVIKGNHVWGWWDETLAGCGQDKEGIFCLVGFDKEQKAFLCKGEGESPFSVPESVFGEAICKELEDRPGDYIRWYVIRKH